MKKMAIILMPVLVWACRNDREQAYTSPNFELVRLAEGVYACIHQLGGKGICNVGIVDNGSETLIFDTFLSPGVAEEIPKIVEIKGLSPIRYVVNSHAHNDHIRGNQVFPEEVDIISTERTARLIREWEAEGLEAEKQYAPQVFHYYDSLFHSFTGDTSGREYAAIMMWRPYYEVLSESHRKVKTRLPNLYLDEQMNLDGPKRRIQLISRGAGHTESDLILYLPDDGIVFTADLVFYEMHPFMGQGFPEEWLKYLTYIENLEVSTVVPGHGAVCGRDGIAAMKAYIRSVDQLAMEMIENHIPIDTVSTIPIPEPFKEWWFEDFFASNLRFMYRNQAIRP